MIVTLSTLSFINVFTGVRLPRGKAVGLVGRDLLGRFKQNLLDIMFRVLVKWIRIKNSYHKYHWEPIALKS